MYSWVNILERNPGVLKILILLTGKMGKIRGRGLVTRKF